jgi:hypothetical protein
MPNGGNSLKPAPPAFHLFTFSASVVCKKIRKNCYPTHPRVGEFCQFWGEGRGQLKFCESGEKKQPQSFK